MTHLIVDFSGRSFCHAHYVDLSLIESLENLYLLNFNERKIKVSVVSEINRLRSSRTYPFYLTFLDKINAQCKVAFINAQSLHKHLQDVAHDKTLMGADIFGCAETRFHHQRQLHRHHRV